MISESDIKFIPKAEFKKKCLPWDDFREKSSQPGVKVIDTRDYIQKSRMTKAKKESLGDEDREQVEKFLSKNKEMLGTLGKKRTINLTFDMLLRNVVNNKRYKTQTLLIFDQVGKQVRWLMYSLEAAGMTDYYFLDKGAFGFIGMQPYTGK